MKYVLFLQDFVLTRAEVERDLRECGCSHRPLLDAASTSAGQRAGVEVLVTRRHNATKRDVDAWCAAYPALKLVVFAFTGYDDVPLEHLGARGLVAYYCPGYSTESVAELAIGLTLAVLRRIPAADASVRRGRFDRDGIAPGIELARKTVGILGTGRIGTASARLFRAFGCQVVGWNRHRHDAFVQLGGVYLERNDVLRCADVLVLHLAAANASKGSAGTRHVISGAALRLLKPSAILVNVARASLVDTNALVSALRRKRLAGAGIDVYDDETQLLGRRRSAIQHLPNVVLTPHLGFKTKESLVRLQRLAIANIGRWMRHDATNRIWPPAPPRPGGDA